MSKTFCRFCQLHFLGLYLNCPKCGKWLAPTAGADTLPDPEGYTLADDQDPFNKRPKTVGEDILIELKRNRELLEVYAYCGNCDSGGSWEDERKKTMRTLTLRRKRWPNRTSSTY